MVRRSRVFGPTCVIAAILASLAPGAADATDERERVKACLDCHGNAHILGIAETVHANFDDPRTPAAQKQCQSCHGPSAVHMKFPMQVENLHFTENSNAKASLQNEACLGCHQRGAREEWKASAHGFDDLVCSTCHSIHDPAKIVPAKATLSGGCSVDGCHATLMGEEGLAQYSHAVGQRIGDKGQMTCTGCHNPHGPLNSRRCLDCHAQSPDVLSKQSEKAQRFHGVAQQKGTECIRCHKGIAHPIPPLVSLRQQQEMERLAQPN